MLVVFAKISCISIHAPRTGSDREFPFELTCQLLISIHAPRTGSDLNVKLYPHKVIAFQSTLPARGATANGAHVGVPSSRFQSTLPARGATNVTVCSRVRRYISIHAPRTGSDSGGGRPADSLHVISIHAPRTGSDHCKRRQRFSHSYFNPRSPHGERRKQVPNVDKSSYFNPRSPHGERHATGQDTAALDTFQSTLPARGATRRKEEGKPHKPISIHAPRTGSDKRKAERLKEVQNISIHAPRTGSDYFHMEQRVTVHMISIHAPRTGSDRITPIPP